MKKILKEGEVVWTWHGAGWYRPTVQKTGGVIVEFGGRRRRPGPDWYWYPQFPHPHGVGGYRLDAWHRVLDFVRHLLGKA
jgi:hypothetical protein